MTPFLANNAAAEESSTSPVGPIGWSVRLFAILGLIALALLVSFVRCVSHYALEGRTVVDAKHLALSIINCESRDGHYPAAYSADSQGRPLLSWRVHILPYLDEKALYQSFHLNEPWDSPHNLTLLDKMPYHFCKRTSSLPTGHTCWLAVVGPRTAIVKPQRMPDGSWSSPVKSIPDGTSRTILIVQVDDAAAVPWTKPVDYEYDPTDPGRDLRGDWYGLLPAAFADGHMGFLKNTISNESLNAAFTRDGGERFEEE